MSGLRIVLKGGQLPDEGIPIRLIGCEPGEPVEVEVSWGVGSEVLFSTASYVADQEGHINPRSTAAFAGSYLGVDRFGLLWSARTAAGNIPTAQFASAPSTATVHARNGHRTADATFVRLPIRPGARLVDLHRSGFVGMLGEPVQIPAPAVVVLGGSDGGIDSAVRMAAMLASRGLVALALAYFGIDGLPAHLDQNSCRIRDRSSPFSPPTSHGKWRLGRSIGGFTWRRAGSFGCVS